MQLFATQAISMIQVKTSVWYFEIDGVVSRVLYDNEYSENNKNYHFQVNRNDELFLSINSLPVNALINNEELPLSTDPIQMNCGDIFEIDGKQIRFYIEQSDWYMESNEETINLLRQIKYPKGSTNYYFKANDLHNLFLHIEQENTVITVIRDEEEKLIEDGPYEIYSGDICLVDGQKITFCNSAVKINNGDNMEIDEKDLKSIIFDLKHTLYNAITKRWGTGGTGYYAVEEGSDEWNNVAQGFYPSLQAFDVKIIAIRRMQNLELLDHYIAKYEAILIKPINMGKKIEKIRYFSAIKSDDNIIVNGIDPRVFNFGNFGQGKYLSKEPISSIQMSKNINKIYQVRALVGSSVKGKKDDRKPRYIPKTKSMSDSACGDFNGHKINVFFDKEQMLPAYEIEFTMTDKNREKLLPTQRNKS